MKYIAFITAVLVLSSLAFATTLSLDGADIVNGQVIHGNKTYNIVFFTQTLLADGSIIKQIVVESEDKINTLNIERNILFAEIEDLDVRFATLHTNASQINDRRENVAGAMELLEGQKEFLVKDVEILQERKDAVDSEVTGNVVLSPVSFRAVLILFVLLLIGAVAANTVGIFSRGKPRQKTPYEDEDDDSSW